MFVLTDNQQIALKNAEHYRDNVHDPEFMRWDEEDYKIWGEDTRAVVLSESQQARIQALIKQH